MTPTELDKLDRLVAEKVMGWDRVGTFQYRDKMRIYTVDGTQWSPTRNIADAWKLIEKRMITLESGGRVFGDPDYRAGVASDGLPGFFYAEAETAPLAITLAALRAKGVEV